MAVWTKNTIQFIPVQIGLKIATEIDVGVKRLSVLLLYYLKLSKAFTDSLGKITKTMVLLQSLWQLSLLKIGEN
jgi:hypothetical protein